MTEKNKRLGRGLAALIGDSKITGEGTSLSISETRAQPVASDVRKIPLARIRANPHNPRRSFADEDLQGLAQSIRDKGVVQPILVRPVSPGATSYELIAGERRWRGAQMAGVHEIPAVVRDVDAREAQEIALIENIQRTDLNPIEEADGYHNLMERFAYTQAGLAEVVGKSRSHVANMLRLRKLPQGVQAYVKSGALTMGHARALVSAADATGLADRILRQDLSVRAVENLIQRDAAPDNRHRPAPARTPAKDANTRALEEELQRLLGMRVVIADNGRGKGKLTISYRTLEQLDALCHRLRA